MNRILLVLTTGLSLSLSANAQKSKITSAYNYLNYGELDKAKEAIDAASEHEKTKEFWKTWFYRTEVYKKIALCEDEKYASLKPGAAEEAVKAYQKFATFDQNIQDKGQSARSLRTLIPGAFNKGAKAYQESDFKTAKSNFELAFNISNINGMVDTTSLFNEALCAENMGSVEEANRLYRKCLSYNYRSQSIYTGLAALYKNNKDTAKALEILSEGRAKYPNNGNMLLAELEIYMAQGDNEKALANLGQAIEKDPTNHILFYARGKMYYDAGNTDKAEADYLKALEAKPDHYDSNFNLGALYFNKGAEMITKAGDIVKFEDYEKAKKEGDAVLVKALPFLEQCLKINPNDTDAMKSLMELYARTNQTDKYQQMKDRITGGGQ